jgi:hypothetical protein
VASCNPDAHPAAWQPWKCGPETWPPACYGGWAPITALGAIARCAECADLNGDGGRRGGGVPYEYNRCPLILED